MTANHEHTPLDTAWIRDRIAESYAVPEVGAKAFDRWLASIEAAAEQRGAEHHLRLVASELNMHHLTDDLTDEALELGVRYINLIQDRADRITDAIEQNDE
jgi:hypothetical protein